MICDGLGLIGKEMIAVDESKFRANNSRGAYYTKKKLDKILKNYAESAEKYLSLLEACDREEDTGVTTSISRNEIKEKLISVIDKIDKFKKIAKEVEANGEIYITDPDSKLIVFPQPIICNNFADEWEVLSARWFHGIIY